MANIKDTSNNILNNIERSSDDSDKQSEWSDEHKNVLYMVCKKTGLSETQAYRGLIEYNGDYRKVIQIATVHNNISVIMKQTDYDRDKAYLKLKEYDFDLHKVIREYMGIVDKPKDEKVNTVNQTIFKEIRGFMDTAMQGYNKRKDEAERMETLQSLCQKKTKN